MHIDQVAFSPLQTPTPSVVRGDSVPDNVQGCAILTNTAYDGDQHCGCRVDASTLLPTIAEHSVDSQQCDETGDANACVSAHHSMAVTHRQAEAVVRPHDSARAARAHSLSAAKPKSLYATALSRNAVRQFGYPTRPALKSMTDNPGTTESADRHHSCMWWLGAFMLMCFTFYIYIACLYLLVMMVSEWNFDTSDQPATIAYSRSSTEPTLAPPVPDSRTQPSWMWGVYNGGLTPGTTAEINSKTVRRVNIFRSKLM